MLLKRRKTISEDAIEKYEKREQFKKELLKEENDEDFAENFMKKKVESPSSSSVFNKPSINSSPVNFLSVSAFCLVSTFSGFSLDEISSSATILTFFAGLVSTFALLKMKRRIGKCVHAKEQEKTLNKQCKMHSWNLKHQWEKHGDKSFVK